MQRKPRVATTLRNSAYAIAARATFKTSRADEYWSFVSSPWGLTYLVFFNSNRLASRFISAMKLIQALLRPAERA